MDRKGDIAVGYSFGDSSDFVGQRFAARLAGDKPGSMTLHESVLADGKAAQTNTLRWEDYTTPALDPSDDCTFWYVGDYLKAGESDYSTKIGSWGGCRVVAPRSESERCKGGGAPPPPCFGLEQSLRDERLQKT